MCVYEFRCVVNLLDLGVAVTGPGRCNRDGIEVKIRCRRSDLRDLKVGDRSRMEHEQIILKNLIQGQKRLITRGIAQGSEPHIYKELNLEEQDSHFYTLLAQAFVPYLSFTLQISHFSCCALGNGVIMATVAFIVILLLCNTAL